MWMGKTFLVTIFALYVGIATVLEKAKILPLCILGGVHIMSFVFGLLRFMQGSTQMGPLPVLF